MEKELFKPVVNQAKAPLGVDPKSIVCEFFKLGMCTKGDKCKFSHNLEVARKSAKIDIYTDRRGKEEDTMETWDQAKLESVVNSKKKDNKTDIVCKFFLEAVENKMYGWFWECPNGGDECKYMHCLPPGFVLKSAKKEEIVDDTPLEDLLEEERSKLTKRTPITLENFLAWKESKKKEKMEAAKVRDVEIKTGKAMRSGKEMFDFNPELFRDDDDDADVMDLVALEPEEKFEGPIITIDATGTSIRRIIRTENGDEYEDKEGKEEEEQGENDPGVSNVQEELFVEDDIPDISDEEN